MRLKIVNESGIGTDTRILVVDRGKQTDITDCFYKAKILLPAEENVKAELWAHAIEIDVAFFKNEMVINRDVKDR